MSGYKLTPAQRFAIYTVHGGVCYLNNEPLYLRSMEVDHVLPRSLKNDPVLLGCVLKEYGLPDNFEIDSYENWLPTCHPCNSLKYRDPFQPTPIIQRYIGRARSKAAEVKALAEKVMTDQLISKAVNTIEMAVDQEQLDLNVLKPLFDLYQEQQLQAQAQAREFRVTPQFTILHESEEYRLVQSNYGVGLIHDAGKGSLAPSCPNCGSSIWSGPRCVNCGHMIDGD